MKKACSSRQHHDRTAYRKFALVSVLSSLLLSVLFLELLLAYRESKAPPEPYQVANEAAQYEAFYIPCFKSQYDDGERIYHHNWENRRGNRAFTAKKASDEVRVFIVGESAAAILYNPENPQDKSTAMVKHALAARFPGRRINIVNCGIPGANSSQIINVIRSILKHEPDLIMLVMGNNVGHVPMWPHAMLRNPPPFARLYRLSRLYRTLCRLYYQSRHDGYFGLAEFFVDYHMIADMISRQNIPFAVLTLPANAGIPPQGYYLPDLEYILTRLMVEQQQYSAAIQRIQRCEYDTDPVLLYLLGKAFMGIEDYESAYESFQKALIHDTDTIRSCRNTNSGIRQLAEQHSAILVDVEKLFEELASHRIIDGDFFFDTCHWYSQYNPLIMHEAAIQMNNRVIAGAKPVSAESLKEPRKLYRTLTAVPDTCSPYNMDVIVANALLGTAETVIFQMLLLARDCKDFFNTILDSRPEDFSENLRGSYLADRLPLNIRRHWYRIPAFAAEAARLSGNLEQAGLLIEKASRLEPGTADHIHIYAALLALELGHYDDATMYLRREATRLNRDFNSELFLKELHQVLPAIRHGK